MSLEVKLKQIENIEALLDCCAAANRTWDWKSGDLGSTGLDSGTTDAATVDGSTTPKEFYVEANTTTDIRITGIQIALIAGTLKTYKFGGANALTNGCDLLYTKDSIDRYIVTSAKKNSDFLIQTGMQNLFSESHGHDLPCFFSNWEGKSDVCFIYIDIAKFMGGFLLRGDTDDRLSFIVNDDLDALNNCKLKSLFVRIIGAESPML